MSPVYAERTRGRATLGRAKTQMAMARARNPV